jgi:hypothetical protein
MLDVVPTIGTAALHLWVGVGAAVLLVGFCGLAFLPPQSSAALRAGSLLLGAILGAAMAWASLDRTVSGDRAVGPRAFELRAEELSARALAPGSPLACLDGLAGENVEAACEKALFVSPASVASASSYVAARFALLSGMAAYAKRGGADIEYLLLPLRRSLEVDRFGFLAHVLAVRDSCTSQNCDALAVLRDPSRVRSNLSARMFDNYLEHYQEVWAKAVDAAPAEAAAPQPGVTNPHRLLAVDFPSAASIPPISIMNPEPTGPVLPGVAAAAAANPNPQQTSTQTKRSRRQTPNPPVQAAAQPVPPGSPVVEPIWPEPLPPPPKTNTAPAGAPVQLSPPSPSASAGATVRTQ